MLALVHFPLWLKRTVRRRIAFSTIGCDYRLNGGLFCGLLPPLIDMLGTVGKMVYVCTKRYFGKSVVLVCRLGHSYDSNVAVSV